MEDLVIKFKDENVIEAIKIIQMIYSKRDVVEEISNKIKTVYTIVYIGKNIVKTKYESTKKEYEELKNDIENDSSLMSLLNEAIKDSMNKRYGGDPDTEDEMTNKIRKIVKYKLEECLERLENEFKYFDDLYFKLNKILSIIETDLLNFEPNKIEENLEYNEHKLYKILSDVEYFLYEIKYASLVQIITSGDYPGKKEYEEIEKILSDFFTNFYKNVSSQFKRDVKYDSLDLAVTCGYSIADVYSRYRSELFNEK